MPPVIHTVGHSTAFGRGFSGAAEAHGVESVVDVRRFPASRRHPNFNAARSRRSSRKPRSIMNGARSAAGARHGRIRATPAGRNRSSAACRLYGDAGIRRRDARLEAIARGRATAILCAEALWWRLATAR